MDLSHLGYELHQYKVLDSTNLEAKRIIELGINGNHVIWALEQTSGYGKSSRKWYSQNKDLTFSLIVQHNYQITLIYQMLFIMSIAVHEVIENIFSLNNIKAKIEVKWPNDIMVDGRKISGILIENLKSLNGENFMIVGIGINIFEVTNPELNSNSFEQYKISNLDKLDIINNIITKFEDYKKRWSIEGFDFINKIWTQNSYKLGSKLSVNNGKETITGTFTGIDNSGAIKIAIESGRTIQVSIGEIFFK